MYNITFKPPLGEAVDIISSPLSPGNQPTSILFSAHLSQANYEKLVQDGGRVQLWSDIPRVGKVNNGAWGKMDFNEDRREVYPTALRRVTLTGSNAKEDEKKDVVLSLLVSLPTSTATWDATKKRRFSFTYRIVYGSGGITWLGQFGKNGVVTVSRAQPDSLYGLALSQGWRVNQAQSLRVFEVKAGSIDAHPVEIAKLAKRSEFRVYTLGEDRLKTDLKNARAIFLVPLQPTQEQSHISIRPVYAISASPGLSASVSDEGLVTLSGSGTAILRSSESAMSGIAPFIEKVLQDGQLTNQWKVLTSDPESKCMVVVGVPSTAQSEPIVNADAFAISLRTSGHAGSALRLGHNQLVDTFGREGTDGFEILLPSSTSGEQRLPVHRFDSHSQDIGLDSQDVVLAFDANNCHFIIRRIYSSENDRGSRLGDEEDAYKVVESPPVEEAVSASRMALPSDPIVLPTPPVSPKLVPLDHHTSSASIDTLVASISSLPAAQDDKPTKTIFTLEVPDSNRALEEKERPNAFALERVNTPPRRPNTVSIFQAIFASIRTFLRVFFRIFLCPIIPFSQGRLRRLPAPTEAGDGARTRDLATEKGSPSVEDSIQDSDLDDDDGELTVTLERPEQANTATKIRAVA